MKNLLSHRPFAHMLIGTLTFLALSCSKSKGEDPGNPPDLKTEILTLARQGNLPSLAVQITGTTNLQFSWKFPDNKILPVTRYGIASATKFISSLFILKLAEAHQIGLDDRIGKYIDLAPLSSIPWASTITVRQLLSHTSGLPEYTGYTKWLDLVRNGQPPATPLEKLKLLLPPDTSNRQGIFKYSNTNYVLLEMIAGAATRQPPQDALDQFCAGLGLANTSFHRPSGPDQAWFSRTSSEIADLTQAQEGYGYEGGIWSTTEDLTSLLKQVFIDKKVLRDSSLTQMMSWTDMGAAYSVDFRYGQMHEYGLGLMQIKVKDRYFIGHYGSGLKYMSYVFIEPATGKEIVLLSNSSGKNYNNIMLVTMVGKIMDRL